MSPRRNRPRGAKREEPRDPSPGIVVAAPAGWQARAVTSERAVKEYRCPGCDHEIRARIAHVVAWQVDVPEERRHWHTGCWERRARQR